MMIIIIFYSQIRTRSNVYRKHIYIHIYHIIHTCIHVHTYINTYIPTAYMHIYIHTYIHNYVIHVYYYITCTQVYMHVFDVYLNFNSSYKDRKLAYETVILMISFCL